MSMRPLSSYEIKKEMEKYDMKDSESPYVYEMIKELVPRPIRIDDSFLFKIDDTIPGDKNCEKNIAMVLNKRFNLGWTEKDIQDGNSIIFTKVSRDIIQLECSRNDTTVYIKLEGNPPKSIEELPSKPDTLEIFQGDRRHRIYPLIYYRHPDVHGKDTGNIYLDSDLVDREDRPRLGYFDQYYRLPVSYLDITFDDECDKKVAENNSRIGEIFQLREERKAKAEEIEKDHLVPFTVFNTPEEKEEIQRLFAENSEIKKNTRNWRYELNIRGLILYILGEIELEKNESRKHNNRISKVLQHLYEYKANKQKFPFLRFYENFRDKYKQIESKERLPAYYEVKLLKKISLELQNLVRTADIDLLNYWVTRRFSGEITYYFIALRRTMLSSLLNREDVLFFADYQLRNLEVIMEYLVDEYKKVQTIYNDLSSYPHLIESLQIYF